MTSKAPLPAYGLVDMMFLEVAAVPDGLKKMGRFCAHVRRGEEIPAELLEYFAESFEEIARSADFAKAAPRALGLARSRGRQPRLDTRERNRQIEISAAVHLERERAPRATVDVCCERLVELYKEKPGTIRDYYQRYRKEGALFLQAAKQPPGIEMALAMIPLNLSGTFSRPRNLSPPK